MQNPERLIHTRVSSLKKACLERGYEYEWGKKCIVRTHDDGTIDVDLGHPNYPHKKGLNLDGHGPGSQLKALLAKIGIKASANCSCNARAALMDHMGIEWCEQHTDEIIGFLREEATKRKLPFIDTVGRALIKMAIKRAKRANKE